MTDAQELWSVCTDLIRPQVSDVVWQTTFKPAVAIDLTKEQLVLAVPSSLMKERIENRYQGMVLEAMAEADAQPRDLLIQICLPDDGHAGPLVLDLSGPEDRRSQDGPGAVDESGPNPDRSTDTDVVNQRYRFEAFVTGTSNRFAHAAALAVAETPARSYNPLFIYGDAGLGKTHLLHAIANYVHDHYPSYRVRYVSTEAFMNRFVDAIRNTTILEFKRRYRDVDVLLVDDIQFMEGKEGLQEEFFHTFNHQANRQIVISSDRPPDSIPTLEDRLRSRFKMGLITDIQPPDLETRLAILRKKAENHSRAIPDDVLRFMADRITNNIRELEGALIRVTAYTNLTDEPCTVELAERVLGDILTVKRPRQITPALILDATSEMFGIPVDEITGASRRRPLVMARQISMYVFRELTDLSYPAIAREFGNRDHTTVIHAVDKISTLIQEKRQVYDQVTELINTLKSSG
jgi:chromosomal replication initiator protein